MCFSFFQHFQEMGVYRIGYDDNAIVFIKGELTLGNGSLSENLLKIGASELMSKNVVARSGVGT